MPELSYTYLEKLVYSATQNHPRVNTNNRRIYHAELNLKNMRLSWFNFFSLGTIYAPNQAVTLVNGSTFTGFQLTGVQIGLNMTVGAILQQSGRIKQTREELAMFRNDANEYLIGLETQVKTRYYKYVELMTALRVQAQLTMDTENLLKQMKYKFERGEETFDSFTKMMQQSAQSKQKQMEIESTVLAAKAALEELVCKKLEEIK